MIAAEQTAEGEFGLNRKGMASSLVTLILGGVVLWVGQTTFQHNGILSGVNHQISAIHDRHESLRARYDEMVNMVSDRTKLRFTAQDGAKLERRIKDVELSYDATKYGVQEKIASLRLQLAAIEVRNRTSSESHYAPNVVRIPTTRRDDSMGSLIVDLQSEIAQLRQQINRLARFGPAPADIPYHARSAAADPRIRVPQMTAHTP